MGEEEEEEEEERESIYNLEGEVSTCLLTLFTRAVLLFSFEVDK